MAQKLVQFGQKAALAAPGLAIRLGSKGADVGALARPHVQKFLKNASVEFAPPGPGDVPAIQKGLNQIKNSITSGKFLDQTVSQASANLLVVAEVSFLFYIGEIIGRRSIIGYNPKV